MSELLPDKLMARRLGVKLQWLRAEAAAGRVPAVDADGRYLFDPDAVVAVLLPRAQKAAEGVKSE